MVTRRTRYTRRKGKKGVRRVKYIKKTLKRRKTKGGSSPKAREKTSSADENADSLLKKISPIVGTVTTRGYNMNKKTWEQLRQWINYLGNPTRNMPQYTKSRGIEGSGLLSSDYIKKYQVISEIWGYHANPYINYERLTHHSYKGDPLRLFQDFSDPLMRNLERLSQGQPLIPSDTTQFLSKVYPTIDFFERKSEAEYVSWFCETVLPNFLSQSNVSTLLYELADQKWISTSPSFDDQQVLLYLSLVARLFLLLLVKDWTRMCQLLEDAGIVHL